MVSPSTGPGLSSQNVGAFSAGCACILSSDDNTGKLGLLPRSSAGQTSLIMQVLQAVCGDTPLSQKVRRMGIRTHLLYHGRTSSIRLCKFGRLWRPKVFQGCNIRSGKDVQRKWRRETRRSLPSADQSLCHGSEHG